MSHYKLDFHQILKEAEGNWEYIISSLCPSPEINKALDSYARGIKKHTHCPVHGGNHGDAFRLAKDFDRSGGAFCNTCGSFSDGIKLIAFLTGENDVKKIFNDINSILNNDPIVLETKKKDSFRETFVESAEKSIKRIEMIWDRSFSIFDERAKPFHLYLINRGLNVEIFRNLGKYADNIIRFNPRLPIHEKGFKSGIVGLFPAIVYKILSPEGKPVTLHRIFFNEDGSKITGIMDENGKEIATKRLLTVPAGRSMTGSAARFGPVIDGKLGVAEGLITAYSAHSLVNGEYSVWSLYNSTVMPNFVIPPEVKKLYIWADLDEPQENLGWVGAGEHHAKLLAKRASELGVKTEILIPNKRNNSSKIDWNDVLVDNLQFLSYEPEKRAGLIASLISGFSKIKEFY